MTSCTLLTSGMTLVGSFCRRTGALAPAQSAASSPVSGSRISWLKRLMKKSRAFFRLAVKKKDEQAE